MKLCKAKAAVWVGLFTMACGGTDNELEPMPAAGEGSGQPEYGLTHIDPELVEATPEILPEPGKEQQALSTWDGYGMDNFGNRCWTEGGTIGWGGGKCWYPMSRKIYYVTRLDSCTGTYAADYRAAFDSAWAYMSGELSRNGFNPILALDASSSSNVVATVGCGAMWAGTPGDALGGTMKHDPDGCSSGNRAGKLCVYNSAPIRLFQAQIETPQFKRAASSLRRTFLRNLFVHEMGHVAGLGHDLCGASPLAQVMNDYACMSSSTGTSTSHDATDYPTWGNKSLTTYERDMLFSYRP